MELKELYQKNPSYFESETAKLREVLLQKGYEEGRIDPLIKVLDAGLVENYFIMLGSEVHVGTYNTLCYTFKEKTGLPLESEQATITA